MARRYCPHCKSSGPSTGGANHILHLLISLCTLGFWVPIWIACALFPAYHCNRCGSQTGIPAYLLWVTGFSFLLLVLIYAWQYSENDRQYRAAKQRAWEQAPE